MAWEQGETQHQRLRAGFATLLMGAAVLFVAWGLAVSRGQEDAGKVIATEHKLDPPKPGRLAPSVGAGMLVYGVVLLVVLFVSIIALMRISRNYRRMFLDQRTKPKPTPVSDVWRMHKPPEFLDDEIADDDDPKPEDSAP